MKLGPCLVYNKNGQSKGKNPKTKKKKKCWAREISFYIPLVIFQSTLQKHLVFFTLGKDWCRQQKLHPQDLFLSIYVLTLLYTPKVWFFFFPLALHSGRARCLNWSKREFQAHVAQYIAFSHLLPCEMSIWDICPGLVDRTWDLLEIFSLLKEHLKVSS